MATNAHNQPQPSNVEPVKEEYIYIYANALERVDGGKRAYTWGTNKKNKRKIMKINSLINN